MKRFRFAGAAWMAAIAVPVAAVALDPAEKNPPAGESAGSPHISAPAATSAGADAAEEDRAYAILEGNCKSCHGFEMLVGRPIRGEEWPVILDRMKGLGANLTDEDRRTLQAYLIKTYSAPP